MFYSDLLIFICSVVNEIDFLKLYLRTRAVKCENSRTDVLCENILISIDDLT